MTHLSGVTLLGLLLCCSQAPPATLSSTAREHMRVDRFDIVSSMRGLPLGVRAELQRLFGSREFEIARDIADPSGRFQGTDVPGDPQLPLRRLIAAECSIDHCLIYYERGGSSLTWHVALFHWTPEGTQLEAGGVSSKKLASIADARPALLTGAIKTSPLW